MQMVFDAANRRGNTALMIAAYQGHRAVVTLLVQARRSNRPPPSRPASAPPTPEPPPRPFDVPEYSMEFRRRWDRERERVERERLMRGGGEAVA